MENRLLSNRIQQLRVRHLVLLEQIQESGSLSGAAENLCITQPAVTVMLQELERAFQAELVQRGRQGARLTSAGRAALTRMRLILNTLSGAEKDLAGSSDCRHLRVGVLSNAMLQLVPSAVAQMRQLGQDVTFEFQELGVESIISGVLDGGLDCAIGRVGNGILQSCEQNSLMMDVVRADPLTIVAAPEHALAQKHRLRLKDLQRQDWVLLPPGTQSRLAFDQAFIQEGLVPPLPVAQSLSFYSNFHLVNKTSLLTTVPASTLSYLAEARLVKPIRYRWPIRLSPLMFFCLKDLEPLPSLRVFRKAILGL